jgi:hypothetical protein
VKEEPELIFIGGAGRSGTTLLRVMIDAHPGLHCGPEAKLVPILAQLRQDWSRTLLPSLRDAGIGPDLVDRGVRAFLETVLSGLAVEGRRLAEKTPHNVLHIGFLARIFPRSRFIHVIRDGRAVAASLVKQAWTDPDTEEPVAYCQSLAAASRYWAEVLIRAHQESSSALGRVIEVRYESLVTDPEAEMRRLLAFLGEPWDDAVLRHQEADLVLPENESGSADASRPIHTDAVSRWRRELTGEQVAEIEGICGELLEDLGDRGFGP